MREPFHPSVVKRFVQGALARERIFFTHHADEELEADGLLRRDVLKVLRGGVVCPGELSRGTYRYRVIALRTAAVIAVHHDPEAETDIWVVTAWRLS